MAGATVLAVFGAAAFGFAATGRGACARAGRMASWHAPMIAAAHMTVALNFSFDRIIAGKIFRCSVHISL